jgi:ubiquinol-cytochrome c reductase cytochrome c subunit
MRRRTLPTAACALLLQAACLALAQAALGGGGDVGRGERLYGQYCSACHGENGSGVTSGRLIGQGPLRAPSQQDARAPSLRGVGEQGADFYLRTGYMPLLGQIGDQPRRSQVRLDPAAIDDLVAYIGSLAPGPPVPHPHPVSGDLSAGQRLFTDHCAGCHQVMAAGGYVTGGVPPPLADATPVQIAEAVRIGPYLMPRFSTRQLSERELDSIIAYLQYARSPDDRGGLALGHLGPVPEGLVAWLAAGVLAVVCVVIGRRLPRVG